MNSPVRLGVFPPAAISTGFYNQRFWGFISPSWNPGLCSLSHSPVVPPSLSAHNCGTTQFTSCCLATHPLHPSCLSLSLLPVWIHACSLTPWLSNFHTVWFSVSSGCFSFLNLLLSFFWLYEEAKCIYLRLNLGQNSEFTGCLSILLTVFFVLQRLSSLM